MTHIFSCNVNKILFDRNNKKYLELKLSQDDKNKVHQEHLKTSKFIQNKKIKNPLEEDILEVKIPFRYKKISCNVRGDKTIHELCEGDRVQVNLKYCGVWNIGEWSGFAWKINELSYQK
jgi:hypothetical protein